MKGEQRDLDDLNPNDLTFFIVSIYQIDLTHGLEIKAKYIHDYTCETLKT